MDSGQNYRRVRGAWPKSRASCQQNGRYSAMLATCLFRGCRVLSRTFQRSPSVIRLFPLLAALLPALLFGQDTVRSPHAGLIAHLQALGSGSDAAKDSISALVKEQLGLVLHSDSGFTATFSNVPISRVEPADGAFRLFTWNVQHSNGTFRYEGFLLTRKGQRSKLYELRDMTEQIGHPETAALSPENWYGAIYYEAVPVKRGNKTYYTLLGWKGHNAVETRKVIEVLSLGGSMPRFGAPLFTSGRQRHQRKVFAFTAQGSMQLKWMPARKAIILDHLSPTRPEFAGQPAFMAPDFTFDSYTWDKDHWRLDRDIDLRETGRSRPFNAPPPEAR